MAKAKFQATIQKNDAHINVLLGLNINILDQRFMDTGPLSGYILKSYSAQIGEMRAQNLEILDLERTLNSMKN